MLEPPLMRKATVEDGPRKLPDPTFGILLGRLAVVDELQGQG
jgi:hypothetical protein